MSTQAYDADVVVVGSGLVGLAAAIAVAQAGLRTIQVAPAAPPDRRTSALMMPSVAFLQEAGLVADPAEIGHPLTRIRIIDATQRLIRAPETLFDASEAGLEAFGWNFPNVKLSEAFANVRAGLDGLSNIEATLAGFEQHDGSIRLRLSDGSTLRTRLLVGADGKNSLARNAAGFRTRQTAFSQSALVCDLKLGRPLGGTSVEFHYSQGPFTLVPAGEDRANLVWIDDEATLKQARELEKDALAALFVEKSQRLFGHITVATPTYMFPLSSISVDEAGGNGIVLVGEAAHAFPPIGAQGLNLGLRDVADLSQALLTSEKTASDWAERVSDDYSNRRRSDLQRTGAMVDTLFRSLITELLPAQLLRASGLWSLRMLPGLRKQAFALGMGSR
jgi:2-octaprenyl-6-methoxyphenol hydroxylase